MNISEAPQSPGAADGRSARWDLHRQERRLELERLARRAVHRLGPAASMEDIAGAGGTSKSVFYRYFGDKDGLRRSMGEVVVGNMRARVLEAARSATTEQEGLHAMVAAYLGTAQTSPNVYFFVTAAPPEQGTPGEPVGNFFAELAGMMSEHMQAYLRARGRSPRDSFAVDLWPRAAIGLVREAGESWLRMSPGPDRPDEHRLAETITRWLLHGIAVPAEDAAPGSQAAPADTASTREPDHTTPSNERPLP